MSGSGYYKISNKREKKLYRSLRSYETRKLDEELENKLPNEFKGYIKDYNYRVIDSGYDVDNNQY